MEAEFGDILFSLINYARFHNINPEDALEKTNRKFIDRFKKMETLIENSGKQLTQMNLAEMDLFWDEAKRNNSDIFQHANWTDTCRFLIFNHNDFSQRFL